MTYNQCEGGGEFGKKGGRKKKKIYKYKYHTGGGQSVEESNVAQELLLQVKD